MCICLVERSGEKEESNFRTNCGGDCQVASGVCVSVVQHHFTLTANLADWLFLSEKGFPCDFFFPDSFSAVFLWQLCKLYVTPQHIFHII